METNRLEAFSDGVIAIIITIMVLEMKVPHGAESALAQAVAGDWKGKGSLLLYVVGIGCAWLLSAWLGMVFFVVVALMWVIPDRRVERVAARHHRG